MEPCHLTQCWADRRPSDRMRLWSLHPRYLDSRGLVAVWREGLLAQAVLRGRTRGYRRHPQLDRFRAEPKPLACIGVYLHVVLTEAESRGYAFVAARINRTKGSGRIAVSRGQLDYEWHHPVSYTHLTLPTIYSV